MLKTRFGWNTNDTYQTNSTDKYRVLVSRMSYDIVGGNQKNISRSSVICNFIIW